MLRVLKGKLQNTSKGTALAVQWLTSPSSAGGTGLIPGQGTKIPHAPPPKKKKKKKLKKKKKKKQKCYKLKSEHNSEYNIIYLYSNAYLLTLKQ